MNLQKLLRQIVKEDAYLKENILHVYNHSPLSQLHVEIHPVPSTLCDRGFYVQQLKSRCIRKKRGESMDGRTNNWPNLVN